MLKKLLFITSLFILCLNSCSSDSEDDNQQNCLQVGNLDFLAESTQININYDTNTSNANSFEIEYGITGFSLGTGDRLTTSNSFALIENLTPNTTYDIYITSICSSESRSEPAELLAITTNN